MTRVKNCPVCGSDEDVIDIIYGTPDSALMKQADEGLIYLGGPDDEDAVEKWHCKKCDVNYK